jgi:hypothetical protein
MKNVKQNLVNTNLKPYKVGGANLFNSPTLGKNKREISFSQNNPVMNKLMHSQNVKEMSLSPFKQEDQFQMKINLNKGKTLHSKISNNFIHSFFINRDE